MFMLSNRLRSLRIGDGLFRLIQRRRELQRLFGLLLVPVMMFTYTASTIKKIRSFPSTPRIYSSATPGTGLIPGFWMLIGGRLEMPKLIDRDSSYIEQQGFQCGLRPERLTLHSMSCVSISLLPWTLHPDTQNSLFLKDWYLL